MKHLSFLVLFFFIAVVALAQTKNNIKSNDYRFSIMFGLSQPLLLHGGNIAVTYTTRKLYFEYSHGFSLDMEQGGIGMTSVEKKHFSAIHLPFSTGFGAGYRLTKNTNLFWELKLHSFQQTQIANGELLSYKTVEMGPALSHRFFIDRNKRFFAEPVVRYWFTTAVLDNPDFHRHEILLSDNADKVYSYKAHEFALFANVSIGMVLK